MISDRSPAATTASFIALSSMIPPSYQMSAAKGCIGSISHSIAKSSFRLGTVTFARLLFPGSF